MSAAAAPRREIDKARWPLLSPLLDELLDLDAPARASRLAALRAQDLTLAQDLEELLARDAAMAQAPLLDSPVLEQLEQLAQGPLRPGQQLGPYALEREIGQGGMGEVWLARRTDGRYEGQVAIKFLSAGLLGRGDSGRFAREGQILGRLAHPHIARLLDAGVAQDGGLPYLVLEYIGGQPIDRFCEQRALDVRARVTLFLAVLAAVAHAHNRLILHRDLKPSNILVNPAGEVKLLDFGIAKLLGDATQAERGAAATELTQQAGRAFTPQYAAPEQVQGGDVTTATDVYALGVLLYLLLSGRHPTAGAAGADEQSPLARMKAVLEVEPRRLSEQVRAQDARRARELRGDLDTIVARALKKAPAERYANAEAMATDLRHWLAHEPILARPDSAGYRLAKFVRRHRVGVAAGTAAVLALSSLTVLSLAQAWRAERAERLAQQRSAQADDLLGYMLGELADTLRPIGRLELLNSVGSKAMAHLGEAPLDQGQGAQALLQRARALTVLGEVSVSKRELQQALAPLAAARRLLAGEPPDAAIAVEWRKAQGTAAFWEGHARYTLRQLPQALVALSAYRDHALQWLALAPQDDKAKIELAAAQTNLGIVQLESGDLRAATQQFEHSSSELGLALQRRPQDLTLAADLANSLTWLGKAWLWQGEFAKARISYATARDGIEQTRRLAPRDLDWTERAATTRLQLGRILRQLQALDASARELRAADELLHTLLEQEPANGRWRWLRASVAMELNELLPPGSAARLQGSRQVLEAMTVLIADPNSGTARRRLPTRAQASMQLARELGLQGRQDEAQALLAALREQLLKARAQQPQDLELLTRELQVQLALQALPRSSPDLAPCRRIVEQGAELAPQLKLHFDITQAWVEAHSCLGRLPAVASERAWLDQRLADRR